MKLSEVFNQLSIGELAQLNMSGTDNIGIQPCDYNKILPHINLALVALFTRFPLKIEEVIIQEYEEIQDYILDSKYAQTNEESDAYKKYIMDTIYKPFTDNVIKIEKVTDIYGDEIYLNDGSEDDSVYTYTYNTIKVVYPDNTKQMVVSYRASHDTIELKNLDPNLVYVHLPPSMVEPFLYYIAARVYANLDTEKTDRGNMYMMKYEASCLKIEEVGVPQKDSTKNTKLDINGWV